MAQLIVALDFPRTEDILSMARTLKGIVPWVKIGLEAFILEGPSLIAKIKELDYQVFLDLKLYDIPNTVAGAVRAAVRNGVGILSIHCQGGEKMCHAAMEAAEESCPAGHRPYIFGVTALTSFGPCEMPGINVMPADFALQLSRTANAWGLDGVICSGQEVAVIKQQTSLLTLCPGIRPAGMAHDDQTRVSTPQSAVLAGADFLVVGRPITRSADPAATAFAILDEMGC